MREVKVIWKSRRGAARNEVLMVSKPVAASFVGYAATRRRTPAFA